MAGGRVPEVSPSKYLITCGWDDVPHLDEATKKELLASTPPYLRAARSKGEPSLGAGAIYPIAPEDVSCQPFPIPAFWPRGYGMDVGWKRTAVVWGAWDRANDIVYLYTEHYRGQADPPTHIAAIKARGDWIPGVIDPAAAGSSQIDGEKLILKLQEGGLLLEAADNAVDAGLYAVWERLSTGRLKIFTTMQNFWSEYRLYRRNERGQIIKAHDHLMDAMRYLILSGLDHMKVMPAVTAVRPLPGISGDQSGY